MKTKKVQDPNNGKQIMDVVVEEKRIETIDMTPTWVWCAKVYMMSLLNGKGEGRKAAEEGIFEMAAMLDLINKEQLLKEGGAERLSSLRKKYENNKS